MGSRSRFYTDVTSWTVTPRLNLSCHVILSIISHHPLPSSPALSFCRLQVKPTVRKQSEETCCMLSHHKSINDINASLPTLARLAQALSATYCQSISFDGFEATGDLETSCTLAKPCVQASDKENARYKPVLLVVVVGKNSEDDAEMNFKSFPNNLHDMLCRW